MIWNGGLVWNGGLEQGMEVYMAVEFRLEWD